MTRIPFVRAILAAFAAEIVVIAGAVLYVALYSYMIAPGHDEAFYQAHASVSSPWVTVILGALVFFLTARWLARRASAKIATALVFWGAWAVLDLVIIAGVGGLAAMTQTPLPFALSFGVKLIASLLGARSAA